MGVVIYLLSNMYFLVLFSKMNILLLKKKQSRKKKGNSAYKKIPKLSGYFPCCLNSHNNSALVKTFNKPF